MLREAMDTTKRRGAPPFNRPVWREADRRGVFHDYTVCGMCNRLWQPKFGPVCTDCKKKHQQAKAERRRGKRVAA